MGIWSNITRLFKRQERFNLTNPSDWKIFLSTNLSKAGINVNEETSLKSSAYYAALMVTVNTVASLPKQIRRRTSRGSEIDRRHDQYHLISRRPNPFQSAFTFWREFVYNKHQKGNGLAYIQRQERSGRPIAYWNLDASQADPIWEDGQLYIKYHRNLPNGQSLDIQPYSNFIHVPNIPTGKVGDQGFIWGSPTWKFAKEAIGLGLAAENAGSNFLKKQGLIRTALTTDRNLTMEQRKLLQEGLEDYKFGGLKEDMMPVLDLGLKFDQIRADFNNIDYPEIRRFAVEEQARFLTFPALFKLGHHDRSNFANAYQAAIEFVQTTVLPEVKPLVQELDKVLRPSELELDSHFVHFEIKGLLEAEPEKRADFHRTMFNMGALSPNRILEMEDMEKLGSEGDETYIMNNMIPTRLANQYWESIINTASQDLTPEEARNILNYVATASFGEERSENGHSDQDVYDQ